MVKQKGANERSVLGIYWFTYVIMRKLGEVNEATEN